jgi:asparagine synthase (glutamine-hydrolysing)
MCGIYGILDLTNEDSPGAALMAQMGRVVAHRGPDDDGAYCGRSVALGIRRLSISLSPTKVKRSGWCATVKFTISRNCASV